MGESNSASSDAAAAESDAQSSSRQVARSPFPQYARAHGVSITAYSPLAKGQLAEHPILTRIGAQYGKTASQVALRWLVQQDGVAVIPKATREPKLRANMGIFDFTLSDDDLRQIATIA